MASNFFQYASSAYLRYRDLYKGSRFKVLNTRLYSDGKIKLDLEYVYKYNIKNKVQDTRKEDDIDLQVILAFIPGYDEYYLEKRFKLFEIYILNIVNDYLEKNPPSDNDKSSTIHDMDEVRVMKKATLEDWRKALEDLKDLVLQDDWYDEKEKFIYSTIEQGRKPVETTSGYKQIVKDLEVEYENIMLGDELTFEAQHIGLYDLLKPSKLPKQAIVPPEEASCKELCFLIPVPSPLKIEQYDKQLIKEFMLKYSIEQQGKIIPLNAYCSGTVINRIAKPKYFIQPGLIYDTIPCINFDRYLFAHNFGFVTEEQLKDRPAIPILKDHITHKRTMDKYNLEHSDLDSLKHSQKCFTQYTVQDQVKAWGIMQNNLCDNVVYLDKLLTFQIMALMSETDPRVLNIDLKYKHIDLSNYFSFDNDYNFYSFKELYQIKLGVEFEAQYFGHVPEGVDQSEVMHIIRYIKLLINDKDHKNKGPFVIQLNRIEGKLHTSLYVVVKLFQKGQFIKDYFAPRDKDRLLMISLDVLFVDIDKVEDLFVDENPIDKIFHYLKKHQVQSTKETGEIKGNKRYTLARLFQLEKLTDEQLKSSPKFYCIQQVIKQFGEYGETHTSLTISLLNTLKNSEYVEQKDRELYDRAVIGYNAINESPYTLQQFQEKYPDAFKYFELFKDMNLIQRQQNLEYEQTTLLLQRLSLCSNQNGIDLYNGNFPGLFRLRTMGSWKCNSISLVIKGYLKKDEQFQSKVESKELQFDKEAVQTLCQEQIQALRYWEAFTLVVKAIIKYVQVLCFFILNRCDNKLSQETFIQRLKQCDDCVKGFNQKLRFQILNEVRQMDNAFKAMEKKKNLKYDASKELIKKDFPEVYKTREDLKDCRCSIQFEEKPKEIRSYSFFISEVLYRNSLKDLIKNLSKKIKVEKGDRVTIKSTGDLKHILTIIEEEEKKSDAKDLKDYVMYDIEGKSKKVVVKMTSQEAEEKYLYYGQLFIELKDCYDEVEKEYTYFSKNELQLKFPNFKLGNDDKDIYQQSDAETADELDDFDNNADMIALKHVKKTRELMSVQKGMLGKRKPDSEIEGIAERDSKRFKE